MSGLPRSGSTLLSGILHQNPSIYVSGTSGILSLLTNIRNHWDDVSEFKSMEDSKARKLSTMKGALAGYYKSVDRPVVIDKCRGWPAHIEMLESLGYSPKIIVTVRDVRSVLSSLENLWIKMKKDNTQHEFEKTNPIEYQTCDGRCRVLMSPGGIVGSSIQSIVDAVDRGYKKHLHFVEYDELCLKPAHTVDKVYDFLEMPRWVHDFSNVTQSVPENDRHYGWGSLHEIRKKVEYNRTNLSLPLGVKVQYAECATFWKSL